MTSQAGQMWCKATLQYPNVPSLGIESVAEMLAKAATIATTAPFQWQYIDKPIEGSIYLVYIPAHSPPPPDGYMYMDAEQSYQTTVQGRQLDIWEHKFGFTPGVDGVTCRLRRRFRLGGKGPNELSSSLWLLFYTKSEENQRVQVNLAQARPQPPRQYPLPQTQSKPFNLFQSQMGVSLIPLGGLQQGAPPPYAPPGTRPPPPQGSSQQQQMQMQQRQQQQQQQQQMRQQMSNVYPGMSTMLPQQQQSQSPHGVAPIVPQKRGYPPSTSLPPHVLAQQGIHGQLPPDALQHLPRRSSTSAAGVDPTTGKPTQADTTTTTTTTAPVDTAAASRPRQDAMSLAATLASSDLDSLTPRQIAQSRYRLHHEWLEEVLSAVPINRIKPIDLFSQPPTEQSLQAQIDRSTAEIGKMKQVHRDRMQQVQHATGSDSKWSKLDDAIRQLAGGADSSSGNKSGGGGGGGALTMEDVQDIQQRIEREVGLRAVPKVPASSAAV